MKRALVLCAVALFAGCGGGQTSDTFIDHSPNASSATAVGAGSSPAIRGALLYVSDNLGSVVYVFSYPKLALVQKLTGFDGPTGECVDAAGDVWIVNFNPPEAIEYAHGGQTPIRALSLTEQPPFGCAVDPMTGNLAVTEGQYVAVYQNASGNPTLYSDYDIGGLRYATYDGSGDLFVDGYATGLIAELPRGGSSLETITLSKDIEPFSMQWDGQYLAVVDGSGGVRGPTPVDGVHVSGQAGEIVRTTLLKSRRDRKARQAVQYWVAGGKIVGPDVSRAAATRLVGLWQYPGGGTPLKEIHPIGDDFLWGTVVSP
jgi:hypothetical protein